MKKLLSIITIFSFMSVSATSVVACSDKFERFDKPKISDKIKNYIIAELANNSKYGKYKFGDLYNDTSTITDLAVRLINQAISQYFYGATELQWSNWANKSDTDVDQF